MPSREFSSWLSLPSTLKQASAETKGFLKTLLNSVALLSLCFPVNDLLLAKAAPEVVFCLMQPGFFVVSVYPESGRQALSALGTTGSDN